MSHSHGGGCCGGPSSGGGDAGQSARFASSGASTQGAAPADSAMAATDAILAELEEMSFDPALEGCCRRDVEAQIRSGNIKRALQAVDRTAARVRAAQAAVLRDPAALAAARGSASLVQDGNIDSDSLLGADGAAAAALPWAEAALTDPRAKALSAAANGALLPTSRGGPQADAELAALREARLQQLRSAAERRREGSGPAAGYGRLNDVAPDKLLALVEDLGGRVVAHLAAEGAVACDHLDEQLTGLAHSFQGTYFARVPLRRRTAGAGGGGPGGTLVAQLGLSALPALVAFRGGAVVGRAPVAQFGGGADIIEEEVFGYLRRLRVLAEGSSSSSGPGRRGGGGDDDDSDAASSSGDERGDPCELCGRTFPHEHVRAMYRGGCQDDDDEGSDFSDGGGE